MNKKALHILLLSSNLLFSNLSHADLSKSTQEKAKDPSFQKNYKRYRGYSPSHKKRVKKKWNSFKTNSKWEGLTPEQKKRLREKVLKKNQTEN